MDTAKRRFVCIIRSAPWITFETEADAEEMKKILTGFGAYTKEKLGNVLVSHKGDRFCFHIPEQGAEYVHEHMKPNEFIRELVELGRKTRLYDAAGERSFPPQRESRFRWSRWIMESLIL